MNKKLFLLLTGSAIALFFACSGEVVESTGKTADLALTVTVQDSITGELLEADVSLNGGKFQQAKNGVAVFNDINTGTHVLLAKIDGYAEMALQTTVNLTTGQTAEISRDYAQTIKLFPLTSSLWGYLRYTDENGVLRPVPADIEVKLRLNDISVSPVRTFVNKLYTAKTDATGKYSFDALPAVGTGYTIWVQESKIGDIDFRSTTISSVNLQTGGTVYLTPVDLTNKANLFVVSSYPRVIEYADIDKPLKFTFTEPVNRNQLDAGSIQVNTSTPFNISWNENNTELTLTPMGNWNGLEGVSFGFESTFKSISGISLPAYNYAITVLLPDLSETVVVPELLNDLDRINYNTQIFVKYNKVPGATQYTWFSNNNNEGVYRVFTPSTFVETGDAVTVYFTPNPNLFREVGILVEAANGNSKTLLDPTKAVKIKDAVKPTYSSVYSTGQYTSSNYDTLYTHTNIGDYFKATDYISASINIDFSEPIQMGDVKLELKNNNGNAATLERVKVERVWGTGANNRVSYRFIVTGSPSAPAGNLDAVLLITDIKDLSGNPFEVQYMNSSGAPIGSKKNQVAIRLYTAF